MVFLGRTKQIHFVGIGGVGMSGIAEVLLNLGFRVTGSDLRRSDITTRLEACGAVVFGGHHARNVEGADVVVYSSAVTAENAEVTAAQSRGVPVVPRAEMLAEIMRLKFAVTVGGSHGKTSTTSLLGSVLAHGGMDPTVIVGGKLRSYLSNARLGSGRYLVAEADESDGTFVRLPSSIAVITNIDREHLDHYGDMEGLKRGFVAYARRVPFYGLAVLCADDKNVREIAPDIDRRKVTYSLGGRADLVGRIVAREDRGTRFSVEYHGEPIGEAYVALPGSHYVSNALAVCAVAFELQIPFYAIQCGLEKFEGVGRRFEIKGEVAGVLVVDDYGHHPTEIAATVRAALDNYGRRLFVLFQPHRFTRTQLMHNAFAPCFDGVHRVIVTDIYAAGESPIDGIDATTVIGPIERRGRVSVAYAPTPEAMVAAVGSELRAGDLGLARGGGTGVAMEAAGVILMRGDRRLIPGALRLSKATLRKIRQNLFWALCYNTLGIPVAALGFLNPVLAGAAMAMSSVSVVSNAALLRRHDPMKT